MTFEEAHDFGWISLDCESRRIPNKLQTKQCMAAERELSVLGSCVKENRGEREATVIKGKLITEISEGSGTSGQP